jgi:atypical dual specificity phosphatase
MWFPRRLLFVVAANSAFQMPQPTRRRSLRRVDAAPPPRTAMSASAVATEGEGDHTETAATATSFAGRAALVMPFVAATAALARAGFPLYGAASPVLVLVHRFLKPDGEPFVERTVKLLALASVWAYWSAGVAYLLLYVLFQLPLTSYHALAVYVPLLIIAFKRDRNARYDRYKRFILRILFDAPLIITAISLRYLCGWHLFTPFASIIDDEVVQGTLPFACDVEELANEPYNVGAVVNMCSEWDGPLQAYERYGIQQLRLPFQDTTAPHETALRRGAAFMKERLENMPAGKRIYVHCKGGIARASTMSLAHYIINRGEDPYEAVDKLKAKRSVVLRSAAEYEGVRAIARDPEGNHCE